MDQNRLSDLADRLKTFISLPIRRSLLSDPFQNPTYRNDQLRANNNIELEREARVADEFFQKICALQPANPSKPSKVAKFNAAFEDAYDHVLNRSKTYNLVRAELESTLRQNNKVALIGRRGSGKTTVLNKWLNDQTATYFESDHGIKHIWFRIDASKIYNSAVPSDVKSYYTAHSVFVFLLYAGMLNIEGEGSSKFFCRIKDRIPQANLTETVDPFCSRLATIIENAKQTSALRDKSVLVVEEIVVSSDLLSTAREIYRLLIRALEALGIGTVCIIDGIDNVSYSKTNSRYQRMCAEMREFIHTYFMTDPNLKKKLLLVSRPETIPELEIRAVGTNYKAAGDFVEVLFRIVEMPLVLAPKVLQRKIGAIRDDEFKDERRTFLDEMAKLRPNDSEASIISGRIKQYRAADFDKLVTTEFNEILESFTFDRRSFYVSRLNETEFLSDFFDGDVRAYLAAFRRIQHGRRYYAALNIRNVDSITMIPEIFVLSGRVYKTSALTATEGRERYRRPNNADLFPNIFWYEATGRTERTHQWHGLCGLRLLQLAWYREKRVFELAKVLHTLFDYPYDVIEEVVQTFVAYGLINVEHDAEKYEASLRDGAGPMLLDNPLEGHQAIVSTTKKGQVCATLSLVYFKWLYFLALDTPLLRYFHPHASGNAFIRFYKQVDDLSHSEFNFWDAVVPTSSVLLKHIFHFHRQEMLRLAERLKLSKNASVFKDYGEYDALSKCFVLPDKLTDYHVSTFSRLIETRAAQAAAGNDAVGFDNLVTSIDGAMTEANTR